MSIAHLVKELRERTGAGILDAKKALEEANHDMEQAMAILKEKGMSKAAKKGDRITAEGLVVAKANEQKAILVEVNSETDFVAKNQEFIDLVNQIADLALSNDITTVEQLLALSINGETLETHITGKIATIGEKLTLRRLEVFTTAGAKFGVYNHFNGQEAAVVVATEGNQENADRIAMHVVAQKPLFLDQDNVDQTVIEEEMALARKRELESGKPEKIVEERILPGIKAKFLSENCLVEQDIFGGEKGEKVSSLATISAFTRFKVGEGIEKVESNFAEEVMAQAGLK